MTALEKSSNIAVIVVALAVVGFNLYDRLSPRSTPSRTPLETFVGKPVPLPLEKGAVSAVLFVSKDCHYCSESMPFYRRLGGLRTPSSKTFKIVTAFPQFEDARVDAQYLAGNQFTPDDTRSVSFSAIGVGGTPTLLLVDSSGTVKYVWVGHLTDQKQEEVVKAVKKLCPECGTGHNGAI